MDKIKSFNKKTNLLEIDGFDIEISLTEDNIEYITKLSNCNFKSSNGDIIYAGITEGE